MATDVLKTELQTYEADKDELVAKGEGKFVLILQRDIAGIWETYEDALQAGYARFGLKPFLVKKIEKIEGPGLVPTAYEIATKRVGEYSSLMAGHARAMDCRDCEDHLLLGVEAFHWIERAKDDTVRAIANAEAELQGACKALERLYRDWLAPCERAIQWAQAVAASNCGIPNYGTFLECCNRARAFLLALEVESLHGGLTLSQPNGEALRAALNS